jgi:hypothetical protein
MVVFSLESVCPDQHEAKHTRVSQAVVNSNMGLNLPIMQLENLLFRWNMGNKEAKSDCSIVWLKTIGFDIEVVA